MLTLPTAVYEGYFALEMSGADPRKDAVKRDIQPESQNCWWSGVWMLKAGNYWSRIKSTIQSCTSEWSAISKLFSRDQ